eukprot:gene9578-biopygen7910
MEAQGIPKETYSSVIVAVVLSKIPENIRNNMIRFGENYMEWNLDQMLHAWVRNWTFWKGHRYFKCSAKVKCDHCKGNHHQLICNSTTADAAPKETRPQATAPAMDPNAAAWVGVGNTSSGGQVALQTALAVVNGNREKRVRVLFDTGSHKTFITSEACRQLGLEPVRSERLGIKAFGSKETGCSM